MKFTQYVTQEMSRRFGSVHSSKSVVSSSVTEKAEPQGCRALEIGGAEFEA